MMPRNTRDVEPFVARLKSAIFKIKNRFFTFSVQTKPFSVSQMLLFNYVSEVLTIWNSFINDNTKLFQFNQRAVLTL